MIMYHVLSKPVAHTVGHGSCGMVVDRDRAQTGAAVLEAQWISYTQ